MLQWIHGGLECQAFAVDFSNEAVGWGRRLAIPRKFQPIYVPQRAAKRAELVCVFRCACRFLD